MKKLTLNVQLKFDDIEVTTGDFEFTSSGRQDLKIVVEDKEWLEEYERENDVEQSLILQEILGDYIKAYTTFMMKLYHFDEEYVQDKVSVAIDEIIED